MITSAYVITDVYIPTFYTSGRRNFINMLDHDEHSIIPENNIRYKYDTKETKTKIRGTQINIPESPASSASTSAPTTSTHPSESTTKVTLHTPINNESQKKLQIVDNLPGKKKFFKKTNVIKLLANVECVV